MISTQQTEQWQPANGYSGYSVSTLGAVRKDATGRIVPAHKSPNGYLRAGVRSDDGKKGDYIHRIVAKTWVPNPEGKAEVNHKNGDKTDNRPENLEWMTHAENIAHAIKYLGRGTRQLKAEGHPNRKLTVAAVRSIRSLAELGETRASISRSFGVAPITVKLIIERRAWRSVA